MGKTACHRCGGKQVASVFTKAPDATWWRLGAHEHEGILSYSGVGSGENVQFDYCIDCGQIQGEWPMPKRAWDELEERAAEQEADRKAHEEWGRTRGLRAIPPDALMGLVLGDDATWTQAYAAYVESLIALDSGQSGGFETTRLEKGERVLQELRALLAEAERFSIVPPGEWDYLQVLEVVLSTDEGPTPIGRAALALHEQQESG